MYCMWRFHSCGWVGGDSSSCALQIRCEAHHHHHHITILPSHHAIIILVPF